MESLIQKPKQPKWDLILLAIFYIVGDHIGVFNSRNLFAGFVFTTNFKGVFMVNQKITLVCSVNGVKNLKLV